MIQIFPKLKQLDETEISAKEKKVAGVMIESDAEDEETSEEELEEDDEVSEGMKAESKQDSDLFIPFTDTDSDQSSTKAYKQLPKIES